MLFQLLTRKPVHLLSRVVDNTTVYMLTEPMTATEGVTTNKKKLKIKGETSDRLLTTITIDLPFESLG